MQRVNRLAAHLLAQPSPSPSPAAIDVLSEAAVLAEPPQNWPEWLPFPVHTEVPRFALGDPEAKAFLEREGYAVIREVLSDAEVLTAIEKLWHEIESRSDAVVRSDPSTWDNGWKTNGWGHDDFLWYVRGCPNVRKVWEQMHDTDDVIVSFDGANIQKPWGLNPEWRGGAGGMHVSTGNPRKLKNRCDLQAPPPHRNLISRDASERLVAGCRPTAATTRAPKTVTSKDSSTCARPPRKPAATMSSRAAITSTTSSRSGRSRCRRRSAVTSTGSSRRSDPSYSRRSSTPVSAATIYANTTSGSYALLVRKQECGSVSACRSASCSCHLGLNVV